MKQTSELTVKEIVTVLAGEGLRGLRKAVEWMYRHWTNDPNFDLVEAVHRTRANQLQRASKSSA